MSPVRQQQLEARVLGLVDLVARGQQVEDDRVELKSEWPADSSRTARLIAGHANVSGGEPILWIIGLDEKRGVNASLRRVEVADWWGRVSKYFDEVAPDLNTLVVPTPHGAVTALQFDTSRTPYLSITDGRGGVQREVPWRTANSIRSARRSELLRAVVAESSVPQLEVVNAAASFERRTQAADGQAYADPTAERITTIRFVVRIRCYCEAFTQAVLPEHRWSGEVTVGTRSYPADVSAKGPQETVGTTAAGSRRYASRGSITYTPQSGLLVAGPDIIDIALTQTVARVQHLTRAVRLVRGIDVTVNFPLAMSTRAAAIRARLLRTPELARVEDYSRSADDLRVAEFTYDGAVVPNSFWYG